jgi:competence protein ComEA
MELFMKKSLIAALAMMVLSSVAFAAVDINTASEKDLSAVKGVGKSHAKSIVEYRMKHGSFKTLNDLEKVPGFSAKKVAKLSKELTVGEPGASAPAATTPPAAPASTQNQN